MIDVARRICVAVVPRSRRVVAIVVVEPMRHPLARTREPFACGQFGQRVVDAHDSPACFSIAASAFSWRCSGANGLRVIFVDAARSAIAPASIGTQGVNTNAHGEFSVGNDAHSITAMPPQYDADCQQTGPDELQRQPPLQVRRGRSGFVCEQLDVGSRVLREHLEGATRRVVRVDAPWRRRPLLLAASGAAHGFEQHHRSGANRSGDQHRLHRFVADVCDRAVAGA